MPRSRKLGMDWFACPTDFAREPALRRPVRVFGSIASFVYITACCLAAREGCAFPLTAPYLARLREETGESPERLREILTMLAEQELFDSVCFGKGYVTNVYLQTEYAMTSSKRKEARVVPEVWLISREELAAISANHPILKLLDAASSRTEGVFTEADHKGFACAAERACEASESPVPSEHTETAEAGEGSVSGDSAETAEHSEASESSGILSLSAVRSPALPVPVPVRSPLSESGKETPRNTRPGQDEDFDAPAYLYARLPRFMGVDIDNIRRLWKSMTPEQIRYAVDETARQGNTGPGYLYMVCKRVAAGGEPYPVKNGLGSSTGFHFAMERREFPEESGTVVDFDAPL